MTITETSDGHWDVLSDSGKTYQLTDIGDMNIGHVLECTCKAFAFGHGQECKHIQAWGRWICETQAGHDDPGRDIPENDDLPF